MPRAARRVLRCSDLLRIYADWTSRLCRPHRATRPSLCTDRIPLPCPRRLYKPTGGGGLGSFSRPLLLLPLAATPRSPLLPLCSSSRAPSPLALHAQSSLWARTRLLRCRCDTATPCDSSPFFLSPRSFLASSSNGGSRSRSPPSSRGSRSRSLTGFPRVLEGLQSFGRRRRGPHPSPQNAGRDRVAHPWRRDSAPGTTR